MALRQFGFGSLGISVDDLVNPTNVVQLGYEPNRIDLITSIDGLDFSACFDNRMVLELEGVLVNFIDLPDLILSKKIAGRLQDLADVEKLEKVQRKGPR